MLKTYSTKKKNKSKDEGKSFKPLKALVWLNLQKKKKNYAFII